MKKFFIYFFLILVISLLITGSMFFLRKYFVKTDKQVEHINASIFSFYTSLYAFFLGFAIVTLWSAYLNAESNVNREADSLLIAFRVSKNLPQSENFRQTLKHYVKSIIEEEWGQMENGHLSGSTKLLFEDVWQKFHLLKPENRGDNDLYIKISDCLSESSQQRLARAVLMKGNLYPPIWVIIIFGFITVCYALFFTNLHLNTIRLIFEFMVVFMVLSCIYFIYDIDTPFSGYITVQPEVFKRVYAIMLTL
jgi:hypothetical protein